MRKKDILKYEHDKKIINNRYGKAIQINAFKESIMEHNVNLIYDRINENGAVPAKQILAFDNITFDFFMDTVLIKRPSWINKLFGIRNISYRWCRRKPGRYVE